MEVLTPVKPVQDTQVEPQGEKQELPQAFLDTGLTMEAIESIQYLGLEHQMFDQDVIEKVKEINEYLEGADIMELDTKIGNPYGLSKLDNMYSYVKLEQQAQQIREKEELINKQKHKYNDSI